MNKMELQKVASTFSRDSQNIKVKFRKVIYSYLKISYLIGNKTGRKTNFIKKDQKIVKKVQATNVTLAMSHMLCTKSLKH